MTELKKKILNLVERAATFQAQGKYSAANDCLIQAVGIMAETLQESKPAGFNLEYQVASDSFKRNLTDIDQILIWKLGLSTWDESRKLGVKYPHE